MPESGSWVLGIDLGGTGGTGGTRSTGSRAALEPLGAPLGSSRRLLPGVRSGIDLGGTSALDVAEVLISAVRVQWPDAPLAAIGIGATGVASLAGDPAVELPRLSAAAGGAPVTLAIDAVTAHLGALAGSGGSVVAVGTGTIAIGTDLRSIWRRVGGWSHLYDDRGSGAWVGIEGLKAAILTHDGVTTDAAALLAAAVARFGPAPEWPAQLSTRDDRGAILAGFAADVAALAGIGDPVASGIMSTAGKLVAGTLAAALDPRLPWRASGVGGVFEAGGAFIAGFEAEFVRQAPDASLIDPAGTPLDGAVRLARLVAAGDAPAGHPPFLWVS
ncbi:ATPase [Streptomyces sp. ISL-90]|nr:ATPase [Streptomyces sp. ISL-90]